MQVGFRTLANRYSIAVASLQSEDYHLPKREDVRCA
ncbi:hypothetical protein PS862_02987 [Pseudomonas fluorescens]|uniref:Uncharacterized protein n=1 Tax=Pseudomonas fluorescens TaxID=294 RepID=A0A5E7KVU6_PSEFL|nr:hypothetical protein PS639_01353 [Pseudomonas fluorescens]VVP03797.1 hypothetical protein PS862_02987 [Pseudomonas fluorescens]